MFQWIFEGAVRAGELAVAGAWHSILDKGIGWAAIAVLLGLAFGSQFLALIPMVGPLLADFFKPLRKDLCWAAFGVAIYLFGNYVGSRDAKEECVAKQVVIEHIVTKEVAKTKTQTYKKRVDSYDSPEN